MSRTITGVRVVAMLPMTDQMKSANGLVRMKKEQGRIFATRENQHGLESVFGWNGWLWLIIFTVFNFTRAILLKMEGSFSIRIERQSNKKSHTCGIFSLIRTETKIIPKLVSGMIFDLTPICSIYLETNGRSPIKRARLIARARSRWDWKTHTCAFRAITRP